MSSKRVRLGIPGRSGHITPEMKEHIDALSELVGASANDFFSHMWHNDEYFTQKEAREYQNEFERMLTRFVSKAILQAPSDRED